MRISIGKHKFTIFSHWIETDTIIGLGSAVDGNHVVFLDLDNQKNLKKTMQKLQIIQDYWLLSDFYLFNSSDNNYHAICLDKLNFGEIINIHRFIGTDIRHDIESLKKGQWFLRISNKDEKPKPRFVRVVSSQHNHWEKSNAHRIVLNKNYNLEIPKNSNYDNYTKGLVNYYNALRKP